MTYQSLKKQKPMSLPKIDVTIIDFDDIKNPLLSGGQARATFEVAKNLVEMGHSVTVISSRFPGSKDQKNKGIYYKHIGLGTGNIKLNNAVFFLALPFAVKSIYSDVILECFTAPISTSFAPIFTKIPVIGMPTMFEAGEFSKKYHLPFDLVEKLGCRHYKYFLAYSKINKKKMHSMNKKVFTKIIPNGVDEDFFKIKTKEGEYALFIGRIDIVQKGLDLLLNACEKNNIKLAIKIVIAGNGTPEEENKLQKMIKEKNLSNSVTFVGRVDGKRKLDLLANSMFGIYPSRFEDFPLVPLEFTSLGKPLVCFDIKGLNWVTPEVSVKVKPFDENALAAAIRLMASKQTLRNKLKRGTRVFAKNYGWKNISKMYEQFFLEVIKMDSTKGIGT